ncbi:phosphotransferase [Spiroplasma endosymbiont of Tipula paludosa]|uniref:phosphotransferase n=1 Tax=Spiroplasma endosymbiont of Tipula paludosa TaxID=3066295 RepID=UPI0035C91D08
MKINWTKAKLTKYGLTNINYSYLDYIIHKSQPFCDIFLDHKTEQLVLPLVKNINVPVIDYFQNDKYFFYITKHIKDALNLTQIKITPSLVKKIAHLIKDLHQIEIPTTIKTWNWKSQLELFKGLVNTSQQNLTSDEQKIINFFTNYEPQELKLCHNDLVPGNILITKQQIYIIDYEYAMKNDPLFDIASFISETIYRNNNLINHFLHEFSLTITDVKTIWWWIQYQNLIWCYWANYLWEQTSSSIYQEILNDKYEELQKGWTNDLLFI